MGRESEYFKVSSLRFLQALTIPRALLSITNRQPLPPEGKSKAPGGTGGFGSDQISILP